MITTASVAWLSSPHHPYEDRYRLLGGGQPRVAAAGRGHLFSVMDGVGGAPLGMRAAQLLADRLPDLLLGDRHPATPAGLDALVCSVNGEVHGWGTIEGSDRPLGAAAATIAWLRPGTRRAHLAHAGDTIAYRFDGEAIHRLTREHGQGRAITRYLGQGEGFRADHVTSSLEEGEWLVLCTDGVTRALRDHDVRDLAAAFPEPGRAAQEIAARARAKGSQDDITVLVVELEEW